MWQLKLWKTFEVICRFLTTGIFLVSGLATIYLWTNQNPNDNDHWSTTLMYVSGGIAALMWAAMLFQKKYCIRIEKRVEDHCYNKLDEKYMDQIPDCSVCMEKPQSIVFGCGHSGICRNCAMKMRGKPCHICRQPIEQFTRGVYDEETYHPELDLRKKNYNSRADENV